MWWFKYFTDLIKINESKGHNEIWKVKSSNEIKQGGDKSWCFFQLYEVCDAGTNVNILTRKEKSYDCNLSKWFR